MQNEIIIAGFGGQGVLVAGILLAYAAIERGLYTTWFPSYGAEMRGGTANSTVIVSSDEIGSPIAFNPNILIALNELSLNNFMPRMIDSSVIIANSSITPRDKEYRVKFYRVPTADIADKKLKNLKTANMVAVGSLIKALEIRNWSTGEKQKSTEKSFTLKSILCACEKLFAKKHYLIEVNKKAIQAGYDFIN
jgi:2-oxoglutarate ferredoxin oxidoreductase subunit gamma